MTVIIVIVLVYITLNLYVNQRISKSYYLKEERRVLHKKLIWFLPFIGPLILNGFWRKPRKVKFQTMTKDKRDKGGEQFYESEIGINS